MNAPSKKKKKVAKKPEPFMDKAMYEGMGFGPRTPYPSQMYCPPLAIKGKN